MGYRDRAHALFLSEASLPYDLNVVIGVDANIKRLISWSALETSVGTVGVFVVRGIADIPRTQSYNPATWERAAAKTIASAVLT